jgi:hypothetical protein
MSGSTLTRPLMISVLLGLLSPGLGSGSLARLKKPLPSPSRCTMTPVKAALRVSGLLVTGLLSTVVKLPVNSPLFAL